MQLRGIHHLTAVSGDIRGNHAFYTGIMGLRLVKRSVNQDDVGAYHLFYSGDRRGAPGNDLTFFDWDVPREQRGTRSITRTCLRVNGQSALAWWADWLTGHGVAHGGVREIDGRLTLRFEDPEGQRLALIDDGGRGDGHVAWEKSVVPAEYQIRGQGPILLSLPDLQSTDQLLSVVLNMRRERQYADPDKGEETVRVYAMGEGGPHAELHVAVARGAPPVRPGAGGVHHVAFRTPDETEYHEWTRRLRHFRVANSGEVDRYWFRSLYFREPNGILFEIATDGPGFAVDEDEDELGERVVLPPFLEARRADIVAGLRPL